jgi:ElaB/YqjD/DUF883 family membrane-anchored ribosome-binding protein
MTDTTPLANASNMLDRSVQRGAAALHDGADAAHQALGDLSQHARQLQADAGHLSQRGLDALRDSTRQIRQGAHRAGERTVGYIQDEPVKAVLVAAAAGAALMALIGLMGRSHR